MKQKGTYGTAISFLLVSVLAVMAFIRGPHQIWFLAGVFVLWGLWMIVVALISNKTVLQAGIRARQQKRRQASESKKVVVHPKVILNTEVSDSVGLVLLRHVSYRISAFLKSAYPDVTWEWSEKNPEGIIENGGTARIRLFGVPDFNFADVIFDQHANIDCDMLRIVPLAQLGIADDENVPDRTVPQQPLDPAVWYDLQGRQVLENLVADLHSRGYSSLIIHENGDICIWQSDMEVEQDKFKNFPSKAHWSGITKVMESAGLAASVEDNGIVVSW